jgi:DNA-binding MarR family transcriptional regulator
MDATSVTRLRRIVVRLARHLNADATGEGLTPSQASTLGQIAVHGPLSIGELSRLEGLNPTMVSRVVGRLGELKLITRKPDPDDLRSIRVQSTPAGKRINDRIRERRNAVLSTCLERLPAEQAALLTTALPALEALERELAGTRNRQSNA